MVGPSSSSSSSSSSFITASSHYPSMKLKNLLLESYMFSQMYINKAKALLLHLLKDLWKRSLCRRNNGNNRKKKLIFGSFRLYYNWCSTAIPNSTHSHAYCSWNNSASKNSFHHYNMMNNTIPGSNCEVQEWCSAELSRYLQWLEEKPHGPSYYKNEDEVNEIDRLADLFIANCHEKFRLEKQESYRMFEEMMARSV